MIKNSLHKTIALALLIVANPTASLFAKLEQKNAPITVEFVTGGALEEEKAVFTRSFKDAYKDIPLDVLKVESLDAFLQAAFEDEPLDLNNPNKKVVCAVAKSEETLVGVIFFEPTERENEVYIRQMAVDPSMQRKGVGQLLMATIQTTLPTTTRLIVATRKVNKPACNFYQKIGFKQCEQVPHGLNPERYVGFEKDIR